MKIELRSITLSKALSEETPAYTGKVFVDGVHICNVSNHGHGGCDMQYPAKGKTSADIDALNATIKATYPKRTYDFGGGSKGEMNASGSGLPAAAVALGTGEGHPPRPQGQDHVHQTRRRQAVSGQGSG